MSSGQTTRAAKPVYGRMYQTPFADRIRNEVGISTIAVGAITDADQANSIIAAGRADLCAIARPHLADPAWTLHEAAKLQSRAVDWPKQYLSGRDQMYREIAKQKETGSGRCSGRGQAHAEWSDDMDLEARAHSEHPDELRLWLRLLTCTQLIEKQVRNELREQFATTLPRFDLMSQLERAPEGLKMNELSRRMMVTGGNVTGITDQLVTEGLVERVDVARRPPRLARAPHARAAASSSTTWRSSTKPGSSRPSRPQRARKSPSCTSCSARSSSTSTSPRMTETA